MTVLGHDDEDIETLIELQGVYDGWSILKLKDGTLINRWADPATGIAWAGYERRWRLTQETIEHARNEPS